MDDELKRVLGFCPKTVAKYFQLSLSRVCAVSTDKINEGRLFNLFVCKPGNRPTFDFVFAFNMDEFGSSRAFHERFTHFLHNVDKERV